MHKYMYVNNDIIKCHSDVILTSFWRHSDVILTTHTIYKLSLASSRQEYYIFSGPPCGIIFSENSEKISSH